MSVAGAGHGVVVRPIEAADLPAVAVLHQQAFPESVLGRLGLEAVRRNYEWQMNGPHDLTAVVALTDGRIAGFLFGGVFRGSTIGFVKKEKVFLATRLVRHPTVLLRRVGWGRILLAARLLARRRAPAQPEEPAAVPRSSFGVLAIAVDPDAQGRGVGRALMAEARRRAVDSGFSSMHLTVHPANASAVSFYRGLGWVETPEPDGAWQGRMRIGLVEAVDDVTDDLAGDRGPVPGVGPIEDLAHEPGDVVGGAGERPL